MYETFGSWLFTFEKRGKTYQVLYDGRDSRLSFENDPSIEKRHGLSMTDWKEITSLFVSETGDVSSEPRDRESNFRRPIKSRKWLEAGLGSLHFQRHLR